MICNTDDFDWQDPTVKDQPATAVYTSVDGAIVIRQERAWNEDGDTIIVIQPEHARTIAKAILGEAGIDIEAEETSNAAGPSSKDSTAAERQRRRRARLRDSHAPEAVTDRDGVTPSLSLFDATD
jgi:hypothetical protein